MKPTAALVVAAVLVAAPGLAAAQSARPVSGAYDLEPTHATILFEVTHLGLSPYVGRFEKFDIDLVLDVDAIENSTLRATVDPTSVDTPFVDDGAFDKQIGTDARLLNGGAFPEIAFVSTSVERTGERTAVLRGDLTLLGQTRPASFDVTLTGAMAEHPFAKTPALGFVAEGVIDRTAWGFDYLAPTIVAPDVRLRIHAEFVKQK